MQLGYNNAKRAVLCSVFLTNRCHAVDIIYNALIVAKFCSLVECPTSSTILIARYQESDNSQFKVKLS